VFLLPLPMFATLSPGLARGPQTVEDGRLVVDDALGRLTEGRATEARPRAALRRWRRRRRGVMEDADHQSKFFAERLTIATSLGHSSPWSMLSEGRG
jgi:hypothetical protein